MLCVHLLIVSAVVARTPRAPLARHRDVLTTQGTVRGYFAPRPPHYVYLGLPYARPPTHARFKAPKPPPSWDGIFEATHRVKCLQPDGTGAEDCLVLNVFTPEFTTRLPVLVHIHDGGFQRGWGSHKPPVRLLRLGFVVVTFNYRLGALGFLCLRTPGVPGNAGLKDQVAALYWVHRNIAYFGGNPQDITLYGTGSGGVSVELLLLSEVTSGLVHKAIIESGAVLSPSSISIDPLAVALAEAITLGYTDRSPQDLEIFYSRTSTSDIVKSSQVHLPCVESNILPNSLLDTDPIEILKHGIYQHVPLLISYTNADEVSIVANNVKKFNTTPQNFERLLPSNLDFETEDIRHKIADLVKDFYFEPDELSNNVVQNYMDYVNDIFMEYPIVKSSKLHAEKSSHPVYLMKYTYKRDLSYATSAEIPDEGYSTIYNYIITPDDLAGFDDVVADRLLSLWSNFIKLGDPTPLTTSLIPVIWLPVPTEDIQSRFNIGKISILEFGKVMINMKPEGQQLIFWDYIYDKFYKKCA